MEALKTLQTAPEGAVAKASDRVAVSEVSDRAAFMALEPEWNALVEKANNQLFYRHEFFRIWIDNFAPKARLRVLVGRSEDGKLVAALPLIQQRQSFYGVPVNELSSAANPHSCRFDLLCAARDAEDAGKAFLEYLRQDKSWDVLRLTDVPEYGAATRLFNAAKEAGMPTGTWPSLNSPFILLSGSFEEQQARLQAKFKANCRRRRKKLEEKGAVAVERFDRGGELDGKLEEGFALEQSGWKGERGTAIAQDKATRGFYTELARESAQKGWLSLYFMRVAGRPVAFHYGLNYGGKYLLLKPGYDESLKECSPGQLLTEDVVKDCIERKLGEFDFLGPDMVWKRDWTDRARQHQWLYVFRKSPFGKALCAMKFQWIPYAKEQVEKWRK